MTATISITEQDVFTALVTVLGGILPTGTEIVQAQQNGVPMPKGAFVAMTPGNTKRLETNTNTYTDPGTNPGTKNVLTPAQFTVQLDFYGPDSMDWANMVQSLLRDDYGVQAFVAVNTGISPLYADDPVQIPLVTGENQYEQRWKLDAVLQINPTIGVSQDFAGALTVGLTNVDSAYPP